MKHPQSRSAAPFGHPAKLAHGTRPDPAALPPLRVLIALLFLGLVLGGCGNRGSLYLPDDEPLAAGNPAATGQAPSAPDQSAGEEAVETGESEAQDDGTETSDADGDRTDDATSP